MKIALVEDDDLTRQRMASLLISRLPNVRITQFQELQSAKGCVPDFPHDFWLVDLGLPDGSGVDLIRLVRRYYPATHILVISVFGDVENIVNSIQAGANGYLLKDSVEQDLIGALDAIGLGGTPLSPMIASALLERMLSGESGDTSNANEKVLTGREAELLNFLSRGYTYLEVAELMQIGLSTVQTHIKHIYTKLAVRSRTEAIYEARVMGLLPK
jgi:DNA-binding NarL/FixJ family response regulator